MKSGVLHKAKYHAVATWWVMTKKCKNVEQQEMFVVYLTPLK